MEEKFEEKETRNNNVEYNSLVSAYRKAYPGIPAVEVRAKAKSIWAKLKERYVMGIILSFMSNQN